MNILKSQLVLYQLVSSSLPIGAFSYSQGLESAVEKAWVNNLQKTYVWCENLLHQALVFLELPLLVRNYQCCSRHDVYAADYWAQFYLATKETAEFRQEEIQRAKAMYKVISQWPYANKWPLLTEWQILFKQNSLLSFAYVCERSNVAIDQMLTAYCWAWQENVIAAAIKLVPLGQSQGQYLLASLSELIPEAVTAAQQLSDDEIGVSSPALAILSSQHEIQYSRLFRS